ncbi:MAG TPA: MOSC domain-containing protein [Clostridiales bacterium]|nr:MOSC domain-containing protein [Clostridiales bacterium]
MAEVISINISSKKGIEKESVKEANLIEGWGLEGDAHAGNWSRQISIFPVEALEKVPLEKKEEVLNGGYTENITIQGMPLEELSVGTVVKIGEAAIKILHIGKEEFKEHGRPYIVSREGRFGKVLKGGKIKVGDEVFVVSETTPIE